jgi:O-antigen/teichoic acid export membrane protein
MNAEPEVAPLEPGESAKHAQGVVLRNTAFLVLAQLFGMPLSIIVNAAMARYLGAEDFGYIYLAQTFSGFGFLVVDWGQISALPAMVARDRSRARELLGSGLAWRLSAAVVVYGVLAGASHLLGYSVRFQVALSLVVLGATIATVTSAFQDTIRGFERADVAAYGLVAQQLLTALFVVPILLLGGRMRAALLAQAGVYAVVCVFVFMALRSVKIGALSVRLDTLRRLLREGSPWVFLGLVNALQPNIDALFLSKLGTVASLGWQAAARKLVGVLVFPSASLISALYPTLCRLYAEDFDGYRRNVNSALRTATVLVVPVSLACYLYADVGIKIFSKSAFGPAEDNLRILSLFVFLLYFTMVLGVAIAAAGRQRPWAFTQFGCVIVSVVADPLLVPWFQRRMGNGGLGVCVATVLSEIMMLVVGFWIVPKGIFDRKLAKGIALAVAAGGAMAVVARVLAGVPWFVSAPLAVVAYGVALWLIGGLDREQIEAMKGIVARKAGRGR